MLTARIHGFRITHKIVDCVRKRLFIACTHIFNSMFIPVLSHCRSNGGQQHSVISRRRGLSVTMLFSSRMNRNRICRLTIYELRLLQFLSCSAGFAPFFTVPEGKAGSWFRKTTIIVLLRYE